MRIEGSYSKAPKMQIIERPPNPNPIDQCVKISMITRFKDEGEF